MTHNVDLQLYAATFNNDEFSSVNNLTRALQTKSSWLAPMVTHAFGSNAAYGRTNFPLSFISEGKDNTESIDSADLSYRWGVMGKPKKSESVAATQASTKQGINYTTFRVPFKSRFFFKSQSVRTPSGLELRVQLDPVKEADGYWWYTFQIFGADPSTYVPASDLKAGAKWGRGIAKVGKVKSRGVESRSHNPYVMNNQLSVVRTSYNIGGNLNNKVMVMAINIDGREFKYWVQWELYLRMLDWKEVCEQDLWDSKYNKDANGVIHNIDEDSGEPIPSGAGMLEQIPNSDTYGSRLTTNKLTSILRDTFFNASDSDTVMVDIYCGTGSLEKTSEALEDRAKNLGFTQLDSHFIGKSPEQKGHNNYLAFGAYFNLYKHIDGHTAVFKLLPLMDKGMKADISGTDENTGLPKESNNMYIIDNSSYDGQNNIVYVSEKGREGVEYIVQGAAPLPIGDNDQLYRATDIDASTIQKIKSQGCAMLRPVNTLKLFNV